MINLDFRTKLIVFLCTVFLVATLSRDTVIYLLLLLLSFYLIITDFKIQCKRCVIIVTAVICLRKLLGNQGFTILIPDMFLFIVIRTIAIFMSVIPIIRMPPGEIIAVLKKMHMPNFITLPLIFMMRFFPTINQEFQEIISSLKLRNLYNWKKPLKTIEYLFVPIMFSSSRTAEELAAAAEVRGISYPREHTSRREIKFTSKDFVVSLITVLLAILLLYFEEKKII